MTEEKWDVRDRDSRYAGQCRCKFVEALDGVLYHQRKMGMIAGKMKG